MTKQEDLCRSESCGQAGHGCCTRLRGFGVALGSTVILERIDLHIHCGELTVITGPNGAGKTTLFRAMLGELPHRGTLEYVKSGSNAVITKPKIGYVPQKLVVDPGSPLSVVELLAASQRRRPVFLGVGDDFREEARVMLSLVEAAHLIERPVGRLSGGELQRVLLALALNPLPELLLLDEPVAGLDVDGSRMFYELVSSLRRKLDLSILLVSHDVHMVSRYADRLITMNKTILRDEPLTGKKTDCS